MKQQNRAIGTEQIFTAAFLCAFAGPLLAQDAHINVASPDSGSTVECERLIQNATTFWKSLPGGVEKAAAKQQLAAARAAVAQHDATSCMSHVKNATTAMRSK